MARKSANHCSTETSSGGRDKIATFILPIKRKSLKRSSWPTQTQLPLPLHGGKNYFPKKLIWSNEEGVVTHFRPNMVILLRPPPAAERVYCRSLVPILASLVPNLASLVAYATRDARFGTRDARIGTRYSTIYTVRRLRRRGGGSILLLLADLPLFFPVPLS